MAEPRLIDANKIVEVAEHAYHEWNLAMAAADSQRDINRVYKMQELCKAVKAVADAAPTVDAVPVVRCKYCKHSYEGVASRLMCGRCGRIINGIRVGGNAVREDHFCSYGERREGE